MSETGPPKGMQAPNTGTQDAALAKKAQEARGSSKVDEVLAKAELIEAKGLRLWVGASGFVSIASRR